MSQTLFAADNPNTFSLSTHLQVTGDFIIEECEVDGNPASQMKRILVRQ